MEFVFDEQKAAQAAAYLLRRHGGPMPYIKLIKLLYLADRRALIETGYPITGDRLVSMPKGPVLSEILSLITWESRDEDSEWRKHISLPSNYLVMAIGPQDEGKLSDYDRDLLDTVFDDFSKMDKWDLVDYTHRLPEWVDPEGSSRDIDPRVILRDAGYSDDEIAQVEDEVAAVHWLRTNFAATG